MWDGSACRFGTAMQGLKPKRYSTPSAALKGRPVTLSWVTELKRRPLTLSWPTACQTAAV